MARIKIKGNRDPLVIPDDKAKKISVLKSDFENKKMDDAWIELEGGKSFYLSKIEEIEIEPERKYANVEFKPMTSAEIEASNKKRIEVRENLKKMGIIKK